MESQAANPYLMRSVDAGIAVAAILAFPLLYVNSFGIEWMLYVEWGIDRKSP